MNEQITRTERSATDSANGRFKDSFSSWFWSSMIAATITSSPVTRTPPR